MKRTDNRKKSSLTLQAGWVEFVGSFVQKEFIFIFFVLTWHRVAERKLQVSQRKRLIGQEAIVVEFINVAVQFLHNMVRISFVYKLPL